jgi:small-conductance mechanosensitive channel
MELINVEFSQSALVKILLYGIILFAVLRAIHRAISMPRIKKLIGFRLSRFFPFIEAIIWILFLIWASQQFFTEKPIYNVFLAGAVVVVIVWASWFALKDVIAGIILRAEDAYETNQIIKLNNLEGKVRKLGYRSLGIETETGEYVKIPYSQIAGQLRVLSDPQQATHSHRFTITVPKSCSLDETARQLRLLALSAPWSSPKKEPQVKSLNDDDENYRFEVVVYSLGEIYFRKIEDYVRARISLEKTIS